LWRNLRKYFLLRSTALEILHQNRMNIKFLWPFLYAIFMVTCEEDNAQKEFKIEHKKFEITCKNFFLLHSSKEKPWKSRHDEFNASANNRWKFYSSKFNAKRVAENSFSRIRRNFSSKIYVLLLHHVQWLHPSNIYPSLSLFTWSCVRASACMFEH
jgi:hypothetical protein